LNVTCVPSDPHTPSILANYLTAPDCVIWSAVLASAAVPGILNPVVLMKKTREGKIEPFSFGHKWKDGSLRTDIPLQSLNLHFNVNFPIVSQVNPHINLFFFSSRGTVGRPTTHRRGRGWRGGFLGSAIEQYIKLDLTKWLKVMRYLELLPRPLGQDWSEIWLQRFSGTITIWPKSKISDFYYILSDPTMQRLAGMIHMGQLAAWPKLKFIANRMAIERVIEQARVDTRPPPPTNALGGGMKEKGLRNMLSAEDLELLLGRAREQNGMVEVSSTPRPGTITDHESVQDSANVVRVASAPVSQSAPQSPTLGKRVTGWFGSLSKPPSRSASRSLNPSSDDLLKTPMSQARRRSTVLEEFKRQSGVFFDDTGSEASDDEEKDLREGLLAAPSADGALKDDVLVRDGLHDETESDDDDYVGKHTAS